MGLEGEVEMWKGREALAKVRFDEAEARVKATEEECGVKVKEAEDRTKELSAVLAAVRKTLAIGGLSEDTSLKVLRAHDMHKAPPKTRHNLKNNDDHVENLGNGWSLRTRRCVLRDF
jgi:hypothetical protein